MTEQGGLLSTAEASRQLGVGTRQVQRLVATVESRNIMGLRQMFGTPYGSLRAGLIDMTEHSFPSSPALLPPGEKEAWLSRVSCYDFHAQPAPTFPTP